MSRLPRLLPAALPAALALLIALPLAGQDKAKGKKYALLVGITEYDHSKLAPLKYTENDVEELARVLDRKPGGFGSLRLLTTSRGEKRAADKPTARNIRAALKDLLAKKTRHDTLLVGLAGHGLQLKVKGKDEAFFCPCDAQINDAATMIGLKALFDQLDDSGAGVKLLLVDACRDDPKLGRNVDVDNLPRPPRGTAALFSCASGQRAFETDKLAAKGHGVFFHFVLEGLRGKAENKAGVVTWTSLTDYVIDKVSDEVPRVIGSGARQSPHEIKNLVGKSPVLLQDTRTSLVKGTKPDDKARWVQLFNGKDLTGWEGQPGVWQVKGGMIFATTFPRGRKLNTFLCTKGNFRDFELEFDAKLRGENNSGVMIRSTLYDRKNYWLDGIKCDLGGRTGWGTLVTYGKTVNLLKVADSPAARLATKANDFNRVNLRCVGKKVSVRINGVQVHDVELPQLAAEGRIGFQLRLGPPTEVSLKNIRIRRLPPGGE
jgi:hypothetical protein